ncbi:MAG: hypothetical protein H2069_00335 [Legionella sp.]|nr:hypothetical protein [Legionella sp.]
MTTLYQVLGLMAVGLLVWLTYMNVKGRPELFTREKLSKSFFTMGVLGIILIAFVAFLVLMLRHT